MEKFKNKYEHNIEKSGKFEKDLYEIAFHEKNYSKKIIPITIEGSVVRLSRCYRIY